MEETPSVKPQEEPQKPQEQPQKPKIKIVERLANLRSRLRFYRRTTFVLIILIVAISFVGWRLFRDTLGLGISKIESTAPYYKEVKRIIKPLRYSAISDFVRPEVWISLDFDKRSWCLHNIHRFNEKGSIILAEGRYGLCGQLAAYVYQEIQPLFGDGYLVEFVRAAESGYFLGPRSSHFILRITGRFPRINEIYILDPSLRRYGSIEHFEDYHFFEKMKNLPFIDEQNPNSTFLVNNAIPMLIRKYFLLSIVVEDNEGLFDKNNFALSLTATHRHKYAGRYIFALRNNKGQVGMFENKDLADLILKEREYSQLREKIIRLFKSLQKQRQAN